MVKKGHTLGQTQKHTLDRQVGVRSTPTPLLDDGEVLVGLQPETSTRRLQVLKRSARAWMALPGNNKVLRNQAKGPSRVPKARRISVK